jgi:hypothetical protein
MPRSFIAAWLRIAPWPVNAFSITLRPSAKVSSESALISGSSSTVGPMVMKIQVSAVVSSTALWIAASIAARVGFMLGSRRNTGVAKPGCMCASLMPGITTRPPRSMTRVREVAIARISSFVPTAAMRSPSIAIASAYGRAGSPVKTLPETNTMDG